MKYKDRPIKTEIIDSIELQVKNGEIYIQKLGREYWLWIGNLNKNLDLINISYDVNKLHIKESITYSDWQNRNINLLSGSSYEYCIWYKVV